VGDEKSMSVRVPRQCTARPTTSASTSLRIVCMHVHDVQATILHLPGFHHENLTYHHAGRDFLPDGRSRPVKAAPT